MVSDFAMAAASRVVSTWEDKDGIQVVEGVGGRDLMDVRVRDTESKVGVIITECGVPKLIDFFQRKYVFSVMVESS